MAKGENVLDHETRRMIYNHILAHPGVSYNILKNVFGLTNGTLRYHLDFLERNKKIRLGLEKGKRLYFPHHNGFSVPGHSQDELETYKLTKVQEQLLNTIKYYPGISQKELIKHTGLKRFTVANNLKKLLNLAIIRKTPNGTNVYYELISNEQLRYELLKGLVIQLLKKEIDEKTFLKLKRELEQ